MDQITINKNRLLALKQQIETLLHNNDISEKTRYISCVNYADKYNQIVNDINKSITIEKSWNVISLHERNPYNMLISQQKSIIDEVLIQLTDLLEILSSYSEKSIQNKLKRKLFISYSNKDSEYVKALVELLEKLGFTEKNMFCALCSPYNVKIGNDIYECIRKEFNENNLHVIYVVSNNYYNSVACQNEVGASWVLRSESTSIFLPQFNINEINGVLKSNEIGIKLDDSMCYERLNELKDKLINEFDLNRIENNIWERSRNNFIDEVKKLVKNT